MGFEHRVGGLLPDLSFQKKTRLFCLNKQEKTKKSYKLGDHFHMVVLTILDGLFY